MDSMTLIAIASIVIAFSLLALIVRLVQTGRLDIDYCWIWLAIGFGIIVVVTQYSWLAGLSAQR